MSKDTVRKCGMPCTSPDAAARTPVSFAKARGRQPPSEHAHPRAPPTIIPGIPLGSRTSAGTAAVGDGIVRIVLEFPTISRMSSDNRCSPSRGVEVVLDFWGA